MSSLKIREIVMPVSKYSIKCPYTMTPTRIVVHNTGNDASAANEIRYMQSNGREVSFHYAVDDREAVLGVPLNRNAWHAGDGGNGAGNRQGIAVEICYSKSGGTKFSKAEENAALLIAGLLKERGWGIDKVTKHRDYSGKDCPHRTIALGWERFLGMIEKYLPVAKLPDEFDADGLTVRKAKDFRLIYHDKQKFLPIRGNPARSVNANFFAAFKSAAGEYFTLPVANFVCDIDPADIRAASAKYLEGHISGEKLRWNCADNIGKEFKGKYPSTLIVPASGKAYIAEVSGVPSNCKYAISGVPVIRGGEDVSWNGFAKKQGWTDGNCRAALHTFFAVRDGEIYVITGKTRTYQLVRTSEVYEKLHRYFDDVIKADGGGSMYDSEGVSDAENRRINGMAAY